MRVPVSWLREYVALPAEATARELADKLISLGLEVETVEEVGADISGPIVVGRVLTIEELTGFKKPIRFCTVDVGDANGTGEPQGIICGARNFAEGDLVVVSLPGAVLPGGFAISARKTYGRMSEGMICSASELGLWEDHEGIIVLPEGFAEPGTKADDLLGLRESVLDIAVTPDRGYALSLRGIAREVAAAYGVEFTDPAVRRCRPLPGGYPASVADPAICSRYVLRGVTGFDPAAPTPLWMRRRLHLCGVRSISLAVDITNYVMLELGQPLHAWDRSTLRGPIEVRLARPGEKLETLDHVVRALDPDDILITDESGPINIAGVMGGLSTEIRETSTDILIEAAHFDAAHIARTSRRHQLSSESSRRFERGVDTDIQLAAATRAVELLAELGGATIEDGITHIDQRSREPIGRAGHAGRVAGVDYPVDRDRPAPPVGCEVVQEGDTLKVTPPSWRPDSPTRTTWPKRSSATRATKHPGPPAAGSLRARTDPRQRLRRAVGRRSPTGILRGSELSLRGGDFDRLPWTRMTRGGPRCISIRSTTTTAAAPHRRPPFALVRVGRGFTDIALFEMEWSHPQAGRPPRPDPAG